MKVKWYSVANQLGQILGHNKKWLARTAATASDNKHFLKIHKAISGSSAHNIA